MQLELVSAVRQFLFFEGRDLLLLEDDLALDALHSGQGRKRVAVYRLPRQHVFRAGGLAADVTFAITQASLVRQF